MSHKNIVKALIVVGLAGGVVGCETKTQTGALVGGLGGAGIGAAIGSASGNAGKGALIGGAVGVVGGGLVGHGMDKADEKKEKERARAERQYQYEERESYARRDSVSRDDVLDWTEDGVSDDVIIDRIESSDTVFRLSARDENTLRDEGVSEDVIDAMKDTARR